MNSTQKIDDRNSKFMPSSISIQNSQREIKYDYADFKKLKKLDRIISNSLTT
jgi:hypothetical protein